MLNNYATFTNTKIPEIDIPKILGLMEEFKKQQQEADKNLRSGMIHAYPKDTISNWARELDTDETTIAMVLSSAKEIPNWFWDRMRTFIETQRGKDVQRGGDAKPMGENSL